MTVDIRIGDAMEVLAGMPDESVHCAVTSPPYWGLRAYKGDPGMIGLEPTFDEHLANLVAVFREVRRVLREDGTLWLNYGDAYSSHSGGKGFGGMQDKNRGTEAKEYTRNWGGMGYKQLLMMPARVAMALQADGWWLRSEIIWHKPNPMPESCRDRPTNSHEKLFLLSRAPKYFYDAEAVRVAGKDWSTGGPGTGIKETHHYSDDNGGNAGLARLAGRYRDGKAESGANLRNVWTVPTFGYPGTHFATFPPKIVEPCIKAGTSEKGRLRGVRRALGAGVHKKTRAGSERSGHQGLHEVPQSPGHARRQRWRGHQQQGSRW